VQHGEIATEHPLTGHPASSKDDREEGLRPRRCVGLPGREVPNGVSTLDPADPHSDGDNRKREILQQAPSGRFSPLTRGHTAHSAAVVIRR